MIRILSVTYKDSKFGGPYAVAYDHKNSLKKKDFYIRLFSHDSILLFGYIINVKRIKKFLNKFDLIHVHCLFSIRSMFILKIAELLSIPTVLSLHGNLNRLSMKNNYLRKIIFLKFFRKNINSVSLIHFLNNSEKEEASNFIDTNKIPYRINQNCIDVSKYEIARNRDSIFKILFLVGLILKKIFKIT